MIPIFCKEKPMVYLKKILNGRQFERMMSFVDNDSTLVASFSDGYKVVSLFEDNLYINDPRYIIIRGFPLNDDNFDVSVDADDNDKMNLSQALTYIAHIMGVRK